MLLPFMSVAFVSLTWSVILATLAGDQMGCLACRQLLNQSLWTLPNP